MWRAWSICRWPACLKPTTLEKKYAALPDICPECSQSAMWSSIPTAIELPAYPLTPLSHMDRRFLASLHIAVDGLEEVDDGA